MRIKMIGAVAALLLATGCTTQPLVINYAPSSTMTVTGDAMIGDFRYIPGEVNDQVQPNQIRNTAAGEALFEKNIDEYFEAAVFNEFRLVGINISKDANVVSGEIIEFLIDDLGFSIDWTLDVRYIVKRPDQSVCYDQKKLFEKHTEKFTNVFGILNEVIKRNIELAMEDPAFVKCLAKKSGALTT